MLLPHVDTFSCVDWLDCLGFCICICKHCTGPKLCKYDQPEEFLMTIHPQKTQRK